MLNLSPTRYSFFHLIRDIITCLIGISFLLFISHIGIIKSQNLFTAKTLTEADFISRKEIQENKNFFPLFNISDVRKNIKPVPRAFLQHIPKESSVMSKNNNLKKSFISIMLPNILLSNDMIKEDMKILKAIFKAKKSLKKLKAFHIFWLRHKFKEYKIKDNDYNELKSRMNIIPPSLALTQAAIESGWGTSRFARAGNALYGEWIWPKKGQNDLGIIPKGRESGKTHQIKKFDNIFAAVRSYMRNLNTHRAYKKLRIAREQSLDVNPMINSLTSYSEKGEEYVHLVHNIIKTNKFTDFDSSKLE